MPKVVTFDGEARSGKGTIVQYAKDYLRDELGYRVMLVDRGQTFRTLVVATTKAGVDLDNPDEIDDFLGDEKNIASCTQFVKDVYRMEKAAREALLYTNKVGEDSAKVGSRPASQVFVANLTKKWLSDARKEGFEVVLIDGRALVAIASEMHDDGLCDFKMGLYFRCDAEVGARRTLGYATTKYEDLSLGQKNEVDELIAQIGQRNQRDFDREVERLAPPTGAAVWHLPSSPPKATDGLWPMVIVDTSASMTKLEMSRPVAELVGQSLA